MKVSVIIPCFNVEQYVEECINSVLKQDHNEIEITCIDNNSTDKTFEIIQRIQEHNSLVQVIKENNQGSCFARNAGIEVANGEYLQFLDADDVLLPDKIKHQVSLANLLDDKPAVVAGDYYRVDLSKNKKSILSEKKDVWLGLLKTRLGITSSNLWNKKKLIESGGWNSFYSSSQEYELLFRLLKRNEKIIFDDQLNALVRDRKTSISSGNLKRNWTTYCTLRHEIINYIVAKKINPSKHNTYYQVLFDSIRTLYKYDKPASLKFYAEFIPKNFAPQVSDSTTRSYINAYNLVGFKATQEMKELLKTQ